MVRWLEANGYDVSYFTGIDSDRFGVADPEPQGLPVGRTRRVLVRPTARQRGSRAGCRRAPGFLQRQRGVLEDALGEQYRRLGTPTIGRWSATRRRTTIPNNSDPEDPPIWTGTWRDPRNSPPADGGRPENALTGTIFTVNDGATTSITVPAEDGKMRFWRNTSIAVLAAGETATLPYGTLGYEWDEDSGQRLPACGLVRVSTTDRRRRARPDDYGSTFASGTATHHLTLYRHCQWGACVRCRDGPVVMGSGCEPRSWPGTPIDARMQQATVNLFADMGVQPATLQAGLTAAAASTDATAPISTITSPTPAQPCRREFRSQSAVRRPIRAGVLSEGLRFQSMAVPPGTRRVAARPGATPGCPSPPGR